MKRALFLLPPTSGALMFLAGIPLAACVGAVAVGQCCVAFWFSKNGRYFRVGMGLVLCGLSLFVTGNLPGDDGGAAVLDVFLRFGSNLLSIAFFAMSGLATFYASLAAAYLAPDEPSPIPDDISQGGP